MRHLRISQSITNRKVDSLERYLNEIGKIELLSSEEEVTVAMRAREGDVEAFNKLIRANLRFVVSVAKNYQDHGLRLSDVISEGNKGLIKAASRFDVTKGFKFISFAVWWIRQSIIAAIAYQKRTVRLPGNQILGVTRARKAIDKLVQQLERTPSVSEVAEWMDIPEERVLEYVINSPLATSLDALISEDSEMTVKDMIPNENAPRADHRLQEESFLIDLRRLLNILSKREQKIMFYYYGLYEHPVVTLDDMVYIFKLSKERIRQLKDQALKTLRTSTKSELLREYLC
ncbi:sigma-70 family RNA polymerase sigma factor [Pedobacter caeni]|uniref:RNA polymerase primary sigma factor n=1 Tax=Pedobacter caeni TaxID=288992 RepID=A0A1M5IVM5_9SPHI|nr:RNA polymerase sigma factor RpoD/SigA [Pedobacter caeni]SHG32321.1 RNA polymerase primary sigma factor [Pedobacter caeni]